MHLINKAIRFNLIFVIKSDRINEKEHPKEQIIFTDNQCADVDIFIFNMHEKGR